MYKSREAEYRRVQFSERHVALLPVDRALSLLAEARLRRPSALLFVLPLWIELLAVKLNRMSLAATYKTRKLNVHLGGSRAEFADAALCLGFRRLVARFATAVARVSRCVDSAALIAAQTRTALTTA